MQLNTNTHLHRETDDRRPHKSKFIKSRLNFYAVQNWFSSLSCNKMTDREMEAESIEVLNARFEELSVLETEFEDVELEISGFLIRLVNNVSILTWYSPQI